MCYPSTDSGASLRLGAATLPCVSEMKDLGLTIDNMLTLTSRINHIVYQALIRVNPIKKCFVSKDVSTLIRAYNVYIRSLLEYATCVWSPSHANAIQLTERVQRKFTRGLPGFKLLSYTNRLTKSALKSLEMRRLHHELIMTYKTLFSKVKVNIDDFFSYANSDYNTLVLYSWSLF